ncbi:MAG: HAD hydrolase-like protein [Candidatus Pacebacteria bacterium]|nr:HAD hydrolase-like protein [Candidatus Paceibacterota bacterium]
MKKIIIFDFDGVLFPNPNSLHRHVLTNNSFSYVTRLVIESNGCIPEHFYENENSEGKKYVETFMNYYFSLKMPKIHKERLHTLSQKHILSILSYNIEDVIRSMLKFSDLGYLFDEILCLEKSIGNKTSAFEILAEHYNIRTSEMSFVTDTISDIKEAKNAQITDIYGVASDKSTKADLMKYLSENKIIEAYYNKIV